MRRAVTVAGRLIAFRRVPNRDVPNSKKAGDDPGLNAIRLRDHRFRDGLPPLELAGLLHPGGGCISGNRAAVMENGGVGNGDNGGAQAQGGESGKDQVFHRNSPSLVGRDVRLR
jgi:hypothetical protein